jgi:hypothetical protein
MPDSLTGADVDDLPTDRVGFYKVTSYDIAGLLGRDGVLINLPWNVNYGMQLLIDDQSSFWAKRFKSNGTWSAWATLPPAITSSVASGNENAVTSGAVYDELVSGNDWTFIKSGLGTSFMYKKIGNFVCLHINTTNDLKFTANATNMKYSDDTEVVLPSSIIPQQHVNIILIDNSHDTMFHARILNTGVIMAWKNSNYEPQNVASWNADIIYRID